MLFAIVREPKSNMFDISLKKLKKYVTEDNKISNFKIEVYYCRFYILFRMQVCHTWGSY